jgi:plasmid stability protein
VRAVRRLRRGVTPKERAAAHGVSAEEEHRRILRRALRSEGFAERLLSMPDVGDDDDFARQQTLPRDVAL